MKVWDGSQRGPVEGEPPIAHALGKTRWEGKMGGG